MTKEKTAITVTSKNRPHKSMKKRNKEDVKLIIQEEKKFFFKIVIASIRH